MAGCNTAMSNIMMSMIVMLTPFVITLLFKYTSNAILASIIISAVLGLTDYDAVVLHWKINKFDFLACIRAFFGVVFVSVEICLVITESNNIVWEYLFAKILLQVTRPRTAVLDGHGLKCSVRSRRQVNYMAGCNTTMSNILMSMIVMLIPFVITYLFKYTSNAILTSIIIYAVLGLIGFDAVVLHWKIDKFDFLACIRAFFGVVFVSVEICLVITESNNIVWEYLFAKILLQVTRPRTAVLGKISKTSLLHGGLQYRDVEYCDVYDYDAYFFLINYLFKYTTNAILASIIISSVLGLIDFDAVVLHWKIDKIGILAYMPAFFGVVFVSVDIGLVITYTSNAILTSIIITAFLGLIDFDAVVLHWKIDKFDFIACIRAFFGVVFVSVEIFLVITVGISFCQNSSTSHTATDCSARPRHHDGHRLKCYVRSRRQVNYMAVCNTAMSNIVICMIVMLSLFVITLLFKYTLNAIIASIIISVVLGLIDFEAVVLHWKIDKFDLLAGMRVLFGVVFVSAKIGLVSTCSVRSRRQVNYMAGCNTAMSNIVMSMIVMLTPFVFTLLFKSTSNAILASITIYAVLDLIDFDAASSSRWEYLFAKILLQYTSNDIIASIIISAVLSFIDLDAVVLHWKIASTSRWEYLFAKILLHVTRPRTSVLDLVITCSVRSRRQANYMAGCNTVMSNIVMSMIVMLIPFLITLLFKYTLNAIIASIIISAVLDFIDFDAVVLHWKIEKFGFLAGMRVLFGMVFVSAKIGLVITGHKLQYSVRSRRQANYMAGCDTAMSNIVMCMIVMLTPFVITLLFKYTSNAILAPIIISAVLGLIDFDPVVLHWKIDKFDFLACMRAFFGVYTSNAILALIIISAVLCLVDFDVVVLHSKIDKFDFLACMRAFFGVVVVSVEISLVITYTSNAILASIIISTVLSLIDFDAVFLLWKIDKFDFLASSIIMSAVFGFIDFDAVVLHWNIDKFDFLAGMRVLFGMVFVSAKIGLVVMGHELQCSVRSRRQANYMAGYDTAMSNIVMSMIVMLTPFVITLLFKFTSNAILASIIISAVLSLIDFDVVLLLWKIDKFYFRACRNIFLPKFFYKEHGHGQQCSVRSRRQVNYMAGCNTAMLNIVMSTIVMLTPFVFTLLFKYTSNAILASIIISSVLGLNDFDAVVLHWKIDKFNFLACMQAFFGVVFVSVGIGLIITVGISFCQNSSTSNMATNCSARWEYLFAKILIQYTSNAIPTSIIISSVLGLIDFDAVVLHWKIDKFDFQACMPAFFGVVFVSVEIGLVITVGISFCQNSSPSNTATDCGARPHHHSLIIISAVLCLVDFDVVVLHLKIDKFDFLACMRAFFGVVVVSVEISLVITYTSNAILAPIIISAVLGPIDFDTVVLHLKIDKFDFLACMRAFFGVLVISVEISLVITVGISFCQNSSTSNMATDCCSYTSNAILALIIISAVLCLVDFDVVVLHSKIDKFDFLACMRAFFGVVVVSVEISLVITYTSNAILASIIISTVLSLIDFDAVFLLWKIDKFDFLASSIIMSAVFGFIDFDAVVQHWNIDKFDFLAGMRVLFGMVFVSAKIGLVVMGHELQCSVRSRRQANYMAGYDTAMSNIVMSMIVMLTPFVITLLFKFTSNAILASIIISAVLSLIDFDVVLLLWKIDKFYFLACMRAFFGVVFVLDVIGLIITVGISFCQNSSTRNTATDSSARPRHHSGNIFLPKFFYKSQGHELQCSYTSNAILAPIIISAVLGPIDFDTVVLHLKIDKFDFLALTRPRTAVLGKIPKTSQLHGVLQYRDVEYCDVYDCLVISVGISFCQNSSTSNMATDCCSYTSNAILALIIISAVLCLVDFDVVVLHSKIDKFDFLACMRAFFGVVVVSVEISLVITYTSNAILASIIISTVLSLIDFDAVFLLWKIDKFDFLASSIIMSAVFGFIDFDAVVQHWNIDKFDFLAGMRVLFGMVFVSAKIGLVVMGHELQCSVRSRRQANYMAGYDTAMSNIVMSMIVMLTPFVITLLFKFTSNAILASIIISAVLSLIDFDVVLLLWKIDKFYFLACMRAFFGVVFVLDVIGLIITVGISFCQNSSTRNTATDSSARPRHHSGNIFLPKFFYKSQGHELQCSYTSNAILAPIIISAVLGPIDFDTVVLHLKIDKFDFLALTRPRTAVLGKIPKTSQLHGVLQYRDVEYCDVYDCLVISVGISFCQNSSTSNMATDCCSYTSNAILALIIISAVLCLVDFDVVVLHSKIDKFDFLACMRAFFGVVVVSVEISLVITYTSNAILASIIISTVLSLIDFDAVFLLWKIDKFDFLASSIIMSAVFGFIDFDAVVLHWNIDKFDFLAGMRVLFGMVFVSAKIGLVVMGHELQCSVRSRRQANYMAGYDTAMSNIVMSMIVMLTPFVITLLFKFTSNAILASIIISAVLSLIDFDVVLLLWKIDKFYFLACRNIFLPKFFYKEHGHGQQCSVRSRRQVNYMAGCNTAMLNIVMSTIVMLTPFVFTLLFKYTSNAILASIIISSVLGLIDFDAVVLHWKIDKFNFLACMQAFFGVVFVSVGIGLIITVGISFCQNSSTSNMATNCSARWEYLFAKVLIQVRRPRIEVLGKIPKTSQLHGGLQYRYVEYCDVYDCDADSFCVHFVV
ncbi:hypothetical protein L1987_78143 [Smallanthus sonchifolius]|uniref:Uncharacterized protein n=1 Tax=Smallanthus sonchifolius TaxID=185202 RepID=A0ACB8ZCW3_9ASTR|nr:hypothetical protein L1987_78143 [Smallanthus sonchifolius]